MVYEKLELNDDIRSSIPGNFIKLSDGYVHYDLAGPNSEDTVVLVHGFSAGYFVWDYTFPFLVNEGFHVLRYDLYGRGFSDRPNLKYDFNLFTRQLHELVVELGLTQNNVNLIGLSMGGGVCMVFADQLPNLVKKISLIDPMGFSVGSHSNHILYGLMKLPYINNLLIGRISHDFLIESQKDDFPIEFNIDDYLKKYIEQMKYSGFIRAIHSTIRNLKFTGLKDVYTRVGENIPVQLLWGEYDKTIPIKVSKEVIKAIPTITFNKIPKAGHQPQYSHADLVNNHLINFIK